MTKRSRSNKFQHRIGVREKALCIDLIFVVHYTPLNNLFYICIHKGVRGNPSAPTLADPPDDVDVRGVHVFPRLQPVM